MANAPGAQRRPLLSPGESGKKRGVSGKWKTKRKMAATGEDPFHDGWQQLGGERENGGCISHGGFECKQFLLRSCRLKLEHSDMRGHKMRGVWVCVGGVASSSSYCVCVQHLQRSSPHLENVVFLPADGDPGPRHAPSDQAVFVNK